MTNQFLPYLNTWKENTQDKPGDLTQNDGSKISVSLQIYHDVQIAVRSTVVALKFLLQNGCMFISTGGFAKALWKNTLVFKGNW